VGPNINDERVHAFDALFQSSVRINVGPNESDEISIFQSGQFQSSVRINVGPNDEKPTITVELCSSFNPP